VSCANALIVDLVVTSRALVFSRFAAYTLEGLSVDPRVGLIFKGALANEHYDNISTNYMYYYLSLDHHSGRSENVTEMLKFPVVNTSEVDTAKELKRSKTIVLDYGHYENLAANKSLLRLNLFTNFNLSFPVNFAYDPSPLDKDLGLIYATVVLLGLYVMIIWELVHRTFAAIIASTMSIGMAISQNVVQLA